MSVTLALCRNCEVWKIQNKPEPLESFRARSNFFVDLLRKTFEGFLLKNMNEAFSVGLEKANYHAPVSDNFNPDFVHKLRENTIKDNLLSYAGEYRLGVRYDEYFYREEKDFTTGESYFSSNEPGPIRDIYRRAIKDRESKGLSVRREVAECFGFEKLEKELLSASVETMAVWVSPPGRKEDGYGDYSFTFVAQVIEGEDGRRVRMVPYRNDKTLEEHNSYLSHITGKEVSLKTDVEALSSPFFVQPTEDINTLEDLLEIIGERELVDVSWKKELEEKARPFLQAFLYLVRTNAPDSELIKVRNAFENFAIAFGEDRNIQPIEMHSNQEIKISEDFGFGYQVQIDKWGRYEPPKTVGSCGLSGEMTVLGQNLTTPMEYHQHFGILQKDKYGERTFNCPSCKKENVRPYNALLPRCQHCNSTEVAC